MRALINAAYTHYFPNLQVIDAFSRTIFQELLFVELVDNDLLDNQYDYLIAACNASCDRSPTFLALLALKQLMKQNKHNDPQEIAKILSILFSAAHFNEERAIFEERYHITYRAMAVMLGRGPMPRFLYSN